MAIAEQALGIVDQGIGETVDVLGGAGLAFEGEKLSKDPLCQPWRLGGHCASAKRALPLMPASRPLVSAGSVPINSRV